jgi:uncharacterized membrane protein (DUF4010 family)
MLDDMAGMRRAADHAAGAYLASVMRAAEEDNWPPHLAMGFAQSLDVLRERSGLHAAAGQTTVASMLLLPLVLLLESPGPPGAATLGALAGLAVLCTALGYLLYFRLLEMAGPVNLLLVTLLIPVTSFGLGVVFLDESLEARHMIGMAAIAGGLVSSTATTLVFARNTDASQGSAAIRSMMVMLANLTMLLRLIIMAAIIRPDLLLPIVPVLGSAAAAGLLWAAWLQRRLAQGSTMPLPVVQNPTQLRVALLFGLAYGMVSLLAAWSAAQVGDRALYVVAAISGLTDVDAIALSAFRLEASGRIDAGTAVIAIAIAVIANLALKTVMVLTVGTRELAWLCASGFGAMALAIAVTAILH